MTAATANKRSASMPHNSEKRTPSGLALNTTSTNKQTNNTTGQRIKNFFRINSLHKDGIPGGESGGLAGSKDGTQEGARTPQSQTNQKSSLRNSRFMPHIGRARSQTVASEGNMLDEGISPVAQANPYFQHQGPPMVRHHNEGSVPPSPPDTPRTLKMPSNANGNSGANDAQASAGREELARKLRRVASAPNAQGLFTLKSNEKGSGSSDSRPATAEIDPMPPKPNGVGSHSNGSALSMVETLPANGNLVPVPDIKGPITPGKLRQSIAFRRTYSSNSIKVRNVEVGPGSFDKIKLIGKGDVGKVYLVREKKSSRLYAMKGRILIRELRKEGFTDNQQSCPRKR